MKKIIWFIEIVCKTENECIVKTWFCWIIEIIKILKILKKKCKLKIYSCALFKINMKFNWKLFCVFFVIHSTSEKTHQWWEWKLSIIEKWYNIESTTCVKISLWNEMLSLTVYEWKIRICIA